MRGWQEEVGTRRPTCKGAYAGGDYTGEGHTHIHIHTGTSLVPRLSPCPNEKQFVSFLVRVRAEPGNEAILAQLLYVHVGHIQ